MTQITISQLLYTKVWIFSLVEKPWKSKNKKLQKNLTTWNYAVFKRKICKKIKFSKFYDRNGKNAWFFKRFCRFSNSNLI